MKDFLDVSAGHILPILFLILSGFLGFNLILYGVLFFITKKKEMKNLLIFWTLFFLAFSLQSIFQKGELEIALGFSSMTLPLMLLSKMLFDSFGEKFPLKNYLGAWTLAFPITFILGFFKLSFFWLALPFCMAFSLPLIHSVYLIFNKYKNESSIIQKILGGILIISIMHGFNFAIFRMVEGAQIWGWSTSFFLTHCLFISLPTFALETQAKSERQRLEKLVEEKTREKSTLLRIILHDLMTPLNGQWNYIDALKTGIIPQEKAFLSIEKYTREIKNILDYVREMESQKAGKKSIDLEPLRVKDCLQETIFNLEKLLSAKNIKIDFRELPDQEVRFLGNKIVFTNTILGNILNNSIKFSHENSTITIEEKIQDNHLVLEIKDNGIGIPKDILKDLFKEGTITSRIGTQGEKGNGLGMLILKESLNQLKAKIEIYSVSTDDNPPMAGTKISLSFPIFN